MTFLAKRVFFMANNVEQELNIDGILLEICSTCVCCPGQSKSIWFLSDTVRQRSSSNFSMRYFAKIACFSPYLICTGCANEM
jgi:hypothetical protein